MIKEYKLEYSVGGVRVWRYLEEVRRYQAKEAIVREIEAEEKAVVIWLNEKEIKVTFPGEGNVWRMVFDE